MRFLLPAAAAVFLLTALPATQAEDNQSTYEQLKLFGDVFERVRSDYVEQVSDEKLIEAAIRGMLSSLDPHSSYMDPESFGDMRIQTRGEFGGLGIEVTLDNGVIKVVSPIEDTPAYRAGLEAGDLITHLDGEPVMGLSLSEAVDKMRGPVDSSLTLTIVRGDQEPFNVTLKRAVIKVQSVRSHVEGDDIGYLRITTFNEQTSPGVEQAMESLKRQLGDKMHGLILDLRNNPGGLLDEAITVADDFLDKGEIVSTRGRHQDDTKRWNATPGDLADGIPMVVLINGGSASASEIVSGALQDHRRAIIMGTKSFGKGSVQTIIPLAQHGAMRLTTARYYTPSGRSIQNTGITPDIYVARAKLEEIKGGPQRREADLPGALTNDTLPKPQPPKEGEKGKPGDQGKDGAGKAPGATAGGSPDEAVDDYQLARAVDLLKGLYLFSQRTTN
ncbi:carboxyl-terminal processing protease [Tistlia consotensis]|uniref:Carboxyl-terminal processing protease n=1 Tax=Tistlia consotensis USBA 355 TaxID=560819 RepID=A0A1Y6BFH3_9PROT|nr:S41 family peptidase [Tistlia consotensis]SMF08225.1 carboxyl-terminal processing protease [Tistlia consotensis USBA 355]SNR35498.1 carboxyl-terminal processing protease [Tistlia consotensis]